MEEIKVGLWVIKPKFEKKPRINIPPAKEVQLSGFVDGRTLKEEDFDDITFSKIYGRAATFGEKGCSIAHLMAYRDLANSDLDAMLILEEDALQVRRIEKWTDVLPGSKYSESTWIVFLETRGRSRRKVKTQNLFRLKTLPHTTTAYIISKKLAQEFIDSNHGRKVFWQADWPPSLAARACGFALQNDFFEHGEARRIANRPDRSAPKVSRATKRLLNVWADRGLSTTAKFQVSYHIFFRELRR